jgi:hypothetical protein
MGAPAVPRLHDTPATDNSGRALRGLRWLGDRELLRRGCGLRGRCHECREGGMGEAMVARVALAIRRSRRYA